MCWYCVCRPRMCHSEVLLHDSGARSGLRARSGITLRPTRSSVLFVSAAFLQLGTQVGSGIQQTCELSTQLMSQLSSHPPLNSSRVSHAVANTFDMYDQYVLKYDLSMQNTSSTLLVTASKARQASPKP